MIFPHFRFNYPVTAIKPYEVGKCIVRNKTETVRKTLLDSLVIDFSVKIKYAQEIMAAYDLTNNVVVWMIFNNEM